MFDVIRDLLRRARQGRQLAIGQRGGLLVVKPVGAVSEAQGGWIAARSVLGRSA